MTNRRRQFVVDQKLQWRLARRHLATWVIGGVLILAFPICVSLLYGVFITSRPVAHQFQNISNALWFPILTALLLLPFGVRDSLRFSNRIAGPVYRLMRQIQDVQNGKTVAPIVLRKGDFFVDLVAQFNEFVREHQALKEKLDGLEDLDYAGCNNHKGHNCEGGEATKNDSIRDAPTVPMGNVVPVTVTSPWLNSGESPIEA